MEKREPFYKLTYFEGGRGRAEPSRMMFHLAGVEFTDERLSLEEWIQGKSADYPLEQLPVLETENGEIAQTTAILNYVAGKLGFLPEGEWERAVCDSILVTLNDLLTTVARDTYVYTLYKFDEIESEKLEEKMKNCRKAIRMAFSYIESQSKKGARFLFGDKMLVADFYLYELVEYCSVGYSETVKNHSEWLNKFLESANADMKLSKYLKTRPPSQFGT